MELRETVSLHLFPRYIVYFGVCSFSAFHSCVGPISCLNWQLQRKPGANLQLHPIIPTIRVQGTNWRRRADIWVESGETGRVFIPGSFLTSW